MSRRDRRSDGRGDGRRGLYWVGGPATSAGRALDVTGEAGNEREKNAEHKILPLDPCVDFTGIAYAGCGLYWDLPGRLMMAPEDLADGPGYRHDVIFQF